MKAEYRGILAVVLSTAVLVLWFTVINPSSRRPPAVAPLAERAHLDTGPSAGQAPLPAAGPKPLAEGGAGQKTAHPTDPQGNLPVKTWTLKNGLLEVDLTSDGAVATGWRVLGYHEGTDGKGPPTDLAAAGGADLPAALGLSFKDADFSFPPRPRFELVAADELRATFLWRSQEVEIKKTIALTRDSYLADVVMEVTSRGSDTISGRPAIAWGGTVAPAKDGGLLGFLKQEPQLDAKDPIYYLDGKIVRQKNPAKDGPAGELRGALLWAGIESRYFLAAAIPRVQGEGMAVEYGAADVAGAPAGTKGVWAQAISPAIVATKGGSAKAGFSVYAGPKEIDHLKAVGMRLEDAIDYGWFAVIAIPILYLLKFFYAPIRNYGVAIILLTIFVKLCLHPINVKSLKSMKAMQELQPKLKELQKKFASDKQRLNQETMQLFRAHKVNPMGGCWPMLLQFPIYIALYKVLWNSIELYHAPFFWFYRDLSAPDPYLITPILLGIFMVAQQHLMPTASADPAQQKMMMIMPVMFSAFMLFLPVGLVVYILVNTVMSVAQQWMYNKGIRYRDLIRGRWLPSKG